MLCKNFPKNRFCPNSAVWSSICLVFYTDLVANTWYASESD